MTDQTLEQVITAWYTDDARGSHLDFDDVPALVERIEAFGQPTDRTVMAPGTTFTAAAISDMWRWAVRKDGQVVSGLGVGPMSSIDSSTIRDVTPAAVTS